MTGTANNPGQDTSQPAGSGTGTSSAAGEQPTTTVLGTQAGPKPAGEPQGTTTEQGKPAKAPEKYADFKIPEGVDGIELDASLLEAATPVMREANLTQEQAQKLVDVLANRQAQQATDFAKQLENEEFAIGQVGAILGHQRESWAAALKTDGEIGGKNFDANVQVAQKAIARFGSPALKKVLNATGLGNHPEFVRFCLKVGQAISEDAPSLGAGSGGGRKPTESVFYGGKSGT